ncbi:MAG: 3'(2'),5'-bisphosphate nucleotidase CysQ [Desulfobacteraceae bacterium]|jgi:3'(2'), 5'-bisphosphate nucleotidase|nr:3'(2'),5'-bisphosphate nucleotidase CysQ [Desulfobacteraceae bacterium]
MNYSNHLKTAIAAAIEAGEGILGVYRTDFTVDYKSDSSPLTLADQTSHKIITQRLAGFGIPVLSEEGRHLPYVERKNWHQLWIVDPLDGTKEFVKKNGEFTVNIALINQGAPMLGVVLAPDREQLYFAMQGLGTYKTDDAELLRRADTGLSDGSLTLDELLSRSTRLPGNRPPGSPYTIVGSRSHATAELEEFVEAKRREHGRIEFIPAGSSLKICLVAEGKADIYPRLGPTMEWDTAAGQAVAECAGAVVNEYESGTPLRYNRPDLLNPWFIVERKVSS